MIEIALLIILALCITAILAALLAASRYFADRWEQHRNAHYEQLTTFQQAMERIIREEQPQ